MRCLIMRCLEEWEAVETKTGKTKIVKTKTKREDRRK